jgi:hypothetical protein
LKTVIEEQETQVTGQAIAREQESRELAVPVVRIQPVARPATTDTQSKVDCYESCLDLSALFLPRG